MAVKTNVEMNGKKYYRITADLGIDSNGKRIRKQFLGSSKKDAESKRDAYKKSIEAGIIDTKGLYLGRTMKEWLFQVVRVKKIKPATFQRYEGLYRLYVEDSDIDYFNLSKILPINIQKYYNSLYENGISSNTIAYVNKLLKMFFNYAVDNNMILKNPCSGSKVSIPEDVVEYTDDQEAQIVPVFEDSDLKLIMGLKEETKIKYIALVSLATGMRKGEVLGLKATDIDYENEEIHIRRSVATNYVFDSKGNKKRKTLVLATKTKGSTRDIPLPKSLIAIIKKALLIQKQEKLKAGKIFSDKYEDFIFLSNTGELLVNSNIHDSWESLLNRAGVDYKKFHSLRHTYATKQFEMDIPLKTVSELLGHSSIEITANIYTHCLKKQKKKAVDILNII